MNKDDFWSDDDIDLDEVVNNALPTQKVETPRTGQSSSTQLNNVPEKHRGHETNDNSRNAYYTTEENDQLFMLKGENAILRDKLVRLQEDQQFDVSKIRLEFEKQIKAKEDYINALNDQISKINSEKEFLTTENKSLNQMNSKKRKIRCLENDGSDTSFSQNDASVLISQAHDSQPYLEKRKEITQPQNSESCDADLMDIDEESESAELKVVIMNQATFFQDEKTSFIEAMSHYIIPGMNRSVLGYLDNITSGFDIRYKDFSIIGNQEGYKSSLLKYLINYQDKNRIDHLLTEFIDILLKIIEKTFAHDNCSILAIPYLISLINFSLNYKPKAIEEKIISSTMCILIGILKEFQDLFKPEFDYFSLPGDESWNLNLHMSMVDYSFMEQTMHFKILKVFTVIFIMDTIDTISKIAQFHEFSFENKSNSLFEFWKCIPENLIINSFLSIKTPIKFIFNTVEILLNSIYDDDKFAFEHLIVSGKTSENQAKEYRKSSIKVLEKVMQFLTILKPQQIYYNVFGLNNLVGNNYQVKLLDMVSIDSGNLSCNANSNSIDEYSSVLNNEKDKLILHKDNELFILKTKLLILKFLETFFINLILIDLPKNIYIGLLKQLVDLIYMEQEIIFRAPKNPNNSFRIELISKSIEILHHIMTENIKLNEIPKISMREMIIALVRVSSRNLNNYSYNIVHKLRFDENYKGLLFDHDLEMKEFDKFAVWNDIISNIEFNEEELTNRVTIETSYFNGIEFNYPDETIDLAREIIEISVTLDESDQLHQGVNFENEEESIEF